jgi:hypothetical protein
MLKSVAGLVLGLVLLLVGASSVSAAECQFVLGFETLRDLIGHDIVGDCLENEHYNAIGDSVQQTTGGHMAWRKADNWTAFTDGYRTWVNGPDGLQQRLNTERFEWEADYTIQPPEHMAYIWWHWHQGQDSQGRRFDQFRELIVDITIHNDVEPLGQHNGLYLMTGYSTISDVAFYFGLQTDIQQLGSYPKKGLIFSRWSTRDLANARYAKEDGWTQSSGHEGDFIGVRRAYAWSAGDYRLRLAPDESFPQESDGVWFGLWITDRSTDETTWIGSLKFPLQDGSAVIQAPVYSTMEIYGDRIRYGDIPTWLVTLNRPVGDGIKSAWVSTGYSMFKRGYKNSEVQVDVTNGLTNIQAGEATQRRTEPGTFEFR